MPRRDFLRTTMATAAVLFTLDSVNAAAGASGGRFRLPEDASIDPDVAKAALGGDEFVMDVQTHFLELDPADGVPAFPQSSCGESDPRLCYSIDTYLDEVFLRSDTNLAVLSAVPAAGLDGPLSPERMDEARRAADTLCGDGRLLMHGQATPQLGPLGDRLDEMNMLVDRYPISSWKLYTHTPGRGWFLDDHEPGGPQVGQAFLDRTRETGVKTVSVHKGLSNGNAYSSPVDIGPAAKANPDLRFVVYHSGYENRFTEGPTNPAGEGVDPAPPVQESPSEPCAAKPWQRGPRASRS
jgi:hypothetical protein